MKSSFSSIFSVMFLLGAVGFIFFTMMPQWTSDDDAPLAEFSTKKALEQIKNISQKPHFRRFGKSRCGRQLFNTRIAKSGFANFHPRRFCLFGLGNIDQMQKYFGSNKRNQQRQPLAPTFAL